MRPFRLMIIPFVLLMLIDEGVASPSATIGNKEGGLGVLPLGLYTVPQDSFDEVKAAGFNVVHIYHDTQTLDEAKAYLEAAEAAELRVSQNMPRDYLSAGDEFWIAWVTALSAYDALAWWYLPEEPDIRGVDHASIARLYAIIHQYDPQHRPAALYLGGIELLADWCDVADIVMLGCYPEYHGEPRTCVKGRIDAAREACPSRTVIGVPPFFDSRDAGHPGGYPTSHQARFDAYTSLIAGAKGLKWFSYQGGVRLPELWEGVKRIVEELNELGPVILSPDSPCTAEVSVISGPNQVPAPYCACEYYDSIQILQKGERGEYLFASNLANETVVAEFSVFSPDTAAVEVLFEGRAVPVQNGKFRDSFAGLGVHVYSTAASSSFLPVVLRESATWSASRTDERLLSRKEAP